LTGETYTVLKYGTVSKPKTRLQHKIELLNINILKNQVDTLTKGLAIQRTHSKRTSPAQWFMDARCMSKPGTQK